MISVCKDDLNILYLNIRSIKKNLDDLNIFLVHNNLFPDLIILTETWLDMSWDPETKSWRRRVFYQE